MTGQKNTSETDRQVLHRGITQRSFKQTFNLADYVKVAGATFENGLLSVHLVREVPEQLKPRRIKIGSGMSRKFTGLNAPAGISYNRFLAKIASGYRKPNNYFVILPEKGPDFIAKLSIEKFHGVGPATAANQRLVRGSC